MQVSYFYQFLLKKGSPFFLKNSIRIFKLCVINIIKKKRKKQHCQNYSRNAKHLSQYRGPLNIMLDNRGPSVKKVENYVALIQLNLIFTSIHI